MKIVVLISNKSRYRIDHYGGSGSGLACLSHPLGQSSDVIKTTSTTTRDILLVVCIDLSTLESRVCLVGLLSSITLRDTSGRRERTTINQRRKIPALAPGRFPTIDCCLDTANPQNNSQNGWQEIGKGSSR